MRTSICFATLIGISCMGCQAPPTAEEFEHQTLAFIRDGSATREQIMLKLGVPESQFENGRIFAYRVCPDPMAGVVNYARGSASFDPVDAGRTVWQAGQYSLILVFDDRGLLIRHSVVSVHLSP
jgi:hypothetical protein